MIEYLERYLGKWIGWREFGRGVLYGASMAFAAALGVAIFYSICVMVLLW